MSYMPKTAADSLYVNVAGDAMSGNLSVVDPPSAPAHAVPKSYVDTRVPAGAIMVWAGASAPAGWQLCNGALLKRADFPDLFAAIGVQYGIGDGVTTFASPNLQGRVVVSTGGEFGLNGSGGASTHRHYHRSPVARGTDEFPLSIHPSDGFMNGYGSDIVNEGVVTMHTYWPAAGAGHGGSNAYLHLVRSSYPKDTNGNDVQGMPPYLVLNYIIKL